MTKNSQLFNYQRSVDELHHFASLFWSPELAREESELSIIPYLLETQNRFISILNVDVLSHDGLFQILEASTLSANLFLKHLCVITDVGGEGLQRYNSEFSTLFPTGEINYLHKGTLNNYKFKALPLRGTLDNKRLSINSKDLLTIVRSLDDVIKDVIVILTFGAASDYAETAEKLAKCEISNYIGQDGKLETFIKQRYIWVSKITSGAKSNTLGQITQRFVRNYLMNALEDLDFSNSRIPGVMHNQSRLTSFDIVVTNQEKSRYVAVEVSFQVTTNSVIERKAGQAKSRYDQI